jgi:hypothetical protein
MTITKAKTRTFAVLVVLLFMPLISTSRGTENELKNQATAKTKVKGSVVYVCACLKNKSCSCMTEAKMEGPCACGTAGGPPLQAVPANSAWAKANRDALAQ